MMLNIYRLLTVYRKIFGTSSYGEGCNHFGSIPEEKFSCDETLDLLNDF